MAPQDNLIAQAEGDRSLAVAPASFSPGSRRPSGLCERRVGLEPSLLTRSPSPPGLRTSEASKEFGFPLSMMAAMVCFSTSHGAPCSCTEFEQGKNSGPPCHRRCYKLIGLSVVWTFFVLRAAGAWAGRRENNQQQKKTKKKQGKQHAVAN